MSMLRISLRNQVRQTRLPQTKPLLPLFEAVMNAFQAIQDSKQADHRITITIEREADLGLDRQSAICGFEIVDTGVGLNDVNFDSFNTSFSEHRISQGGKGLGRFIWLKAFDRVEIHSVFTEPDAPSCLQRKFVFDTSYDPDHATPTPSAQAEVGTIVRLIGYKPPYKDTCPRLAEVVAQRLIEHFLLFFLRPDCPRLELVDNEERITLNELFISEMQSSASDHRFDIGDVEFRLRGFRLTTPRLTKHRLIFAAHYRGVLTDNLDIAIPNLSGRLLDTGDRSFVYLAIVQSDYLDQRVNHERTSFDMPEDNPSEDTQQPLLEPTIGLTDIRDACVTYVNEDLRDVLQGIGEAKEERILQYVAEEAPQYSVLMRYRDEFLDRIAPSASKSEIELALHKELHQREVQLKVDGARIITEAARIDDYEGYQQRFAEFMERNNELGVSALAQYVAHRKIILDFLERSISLNAETEKYPLEKAVHNIIFPMRRSSDDILYSQQNLWIIDEQLNYHSFIASDKPLNGVEHFASDSAKRPDLFIFDRKIVFAEGEQPIGSLIVVEFKRPQRDDYRGNDNPLTQVFDTINEIRAGTFHDHKGRPVSVANDTIPAYGYVICDLTPSFKKILVGMDAQETPDRQSYYGYHRNFRIYFEIIDYNKLLRDAKRRNRIFFERLNILGNQ